MLQASQIKNLSNAVMFAGLGVLFITNYWWPGIMFVLGVSKAIEYLSQNQLKETLLILLIFIGVPVALILIKKFPINLNEVTGYILISIGAFYLTKAYFRK